MRGPLTVFSENVDCVVGLRGVVLYLVRLVEGYNGPAVLNRNIDKQAVRDWFDVEYRRPVSGDDVGGRVVAGDVYSRVCALKTSEIRV